VKRATDRSLREVADDLLFRPLGMRHTHFHDDHTHVVPQRALGYAPTAGGGFRQSMTTLDMVGDGGVFTSAEDMALWLRELATEEVLGAGLHELIRSRGRLKGPETAEREPGNSVLGNSVLGDTVFGDYAFGLAHGTYRGLRTLGHGGAFVGYRASLDTFPDQGLGVVTLCNSASAGPSLINRQVADVLLAAELGEQEEPEPRAPERLGPGAGAESAIALDEGESIEAPGWLGTWYAPELDARYTLEQRGALLVVKVEPGLDASLRAQRGPEGELRFTNGFLTLRAEAPAGRVEHASVLRLDAGRVRNLKLERASPR